MCNKLLPRMLLALYLILFLSMATGQCPNDNPTIEELIQSEKDTVEGPFTVEELEKKHMIKIRETGEMKPFGYSNDGWRKLKSRMQEGDKIFFTTHRDGVYYHDAHVLIRDGCVVYFLLGTIT